MQKAKQNERKQTQTNKNMGLQRKIGNSDCNEGYFSAVMTPRIKVRASTLYTEP